MPVINMQQKPGPLWAAGDFSKFSVYNWGQG